MQVESAASVPIQSCLPEQWALKSPGAEPLWGLFHRLVEAHPAAMLIMRIEQHVRRIVYANRAFYRLLGRDSSEILGRDWNSIWTSAGCRFDAQPSLHVAKEDDASELTIGVQDEQGNTRWLSVNTWPLRDRIGAATHQVTVLRDVTAERVCRDRLEQCAYYDALTGLANRHLFHDHFGAAVARVRRYGGCFVLALLDMDGFKGVNDRFGHAGGDQVLKCFGARLAASVRAEDTVARLGGDEFAMLLLDAHADGSPEQAVERVALKAVKRPVLLAGTRLTLSCSVGIACYPRDGSGLDALLEAADAALYGAKTARIARVDWGSDAKHE